MGDELYYDPYDFEIDADPHPLWRRMRDEQPLYYNEQYDFFALSRFDDVEQGLIDWDTYQSGKGSVLELIRAASDEHCVVLGEQTQVHLLDVRHERHDVDRAFSQTRIGGADLR